MRFLWITFVVLAACDTAGLGFRGLDPVRVAAGGAEFDLRHRGDDVIEAIRVSKHVFPRFDWVALRAAQAGEQHSGCVVKWIMGDPSVVQLGLSCNGKKAVKIPRGPRVLYCETVTTRVRAGGLHHGLMTCTG